MALIFPSSAVDSPTSTTATPPPEPFFNDRIDPVIADTEALKILKRTERNAQSLAAFEGVEGAEKSEAVIALKTERQGLVTELASYRDYAQRKGIPMFGMKPEVEARNRAKDNENQVGKVLNLMQADDSTFNSLIAEKGDAEDFALLKTMIGDDKTAKTEYLKTAAMREFGYSDREIESGFAEPHLREKLKADKLEPTGNAILRWSLDQKNQLDRRKKVSDSAMMTAYSQFMQMKDTEDGFEKELATASPDITDTERVYARVIRNNQYERLEKELPGVRDMVKKTFNMISAQEGTPTKFGGEVFASMDEAVKAFSTLPKEQFPQVVAMLAGTAQAHGQDVDGVMNSVARLWERGVQDLGSDALTSWQRWGMGELEKQFGKGITVETEKPDGTRTSQNFDEIRNELDYASQLRNWRKSVAKVRDDNWLIDGWVYGTASSLPEMAAVFIPGGLPIVAAAQTERNMTELRKQHPDVDPEKFRDGAMIAGFAYATLNKIGVDALFSKVPAFKSFLGKYTSLLAFETAVELGQDGALPVVMKAYEMADKEMPGVNLFGEGSELAALVKQSPQIAFSMMPLVLMGVGGSKAVEYMDAVQLKKLLNNSSYLAEYGMNADEIAKVQALPVMEAASFIQSRGLPTSTQDSAGEMQTPNFNPIGYASPNVTVNMNPDGKTFSVSNDTTTIEARSPEEVAEVARQLDPETFTANSQQAAKPTQEESDALVLDMTIRPGDPNITVLNSFILPPLSDVTGSLTKEDSFRVSEGLPPVPDMAREGQIGAQARFRFGLQSFASSRRIPSKSLDKISVVAQRRIAAVESQFNEIAKALNSRVNKHIAKRPAALRDAEFVKIQSDAYKALRGDDVAMKALPTKVRRVVEQGRESIDLYSQRLVASNAINPELAQKLGDNLGSYVTRQFKAFDPDAKWNYATVKKQHPAIFNAALDYISRSKSIPTKEADGIIREILDPARAENFYTGQAKVGKVDTSSFIARKDLAPEIIELLGEVRNPAVNIKQTGSKVSKAVITYDAQNAMAEWLLANKLASRKPNPDLRHFEDSRIGSETYSFPAYDKETDTWGVGQGVRTKKAFAGFGELYLEPELHAALTAIFEGGASQQSRFQTGFNLLAKVTSVGKFSQVLLNPAAYPTNFMGGVATEILNGRISFNGVRAYGQFGSLRNIGENPNDVYGVKEQTEFYQLTGAQFEAKGGMDSIGRNQLNTEMEMGGIRNVSVFARDLQDTVDMAYGEGAIAKTTFFLGKGYQAADNAAKRSAFATELAKWVKAEPGTTMDILVQKATEDVRATTQNYDLVPKVLREFSQRGVIVPTYISFAYELVRNTVGTAKLARQELLSGNPVLRNAGLRRVAGMATLGAMMYALNTLISSVVAGMTDDDRKELDALLPPWLKGKNVAYLRADDEKLHYFDPSYLIPHQIFYNAATASLAAAEKGNMAGAVLDPTLEILGGFGDLNILNATVAEAITNQKRGGGRIFNPEMVDEVGKANAIGKHFIDSMFKPGFLRTYEKMQKASKGEVGFAGSMATTDDLFLNAFGIRPYTVDTSSEKFLTDNLVEFSFRNRDISAELSDRKKAKMSPTELAEKEAAVTKARQKLMDDLNKKVSAFQALGVSEKRIRDAAKAAKIPKALKIEFSATQRIGLEPDEK